MKMKKIKNMLADIVLTMIINTYMYCPKCLIVFLGLFIFVVNGQSQTNIHVEKLKCKNDMEYSLELRVFYDSYNYEFAKENRFISYFPKEPHPRNYITSHSAFNALPDSIKLVIVKELLSFENDTSLCCYLVQELPFDGNDGCCRSPQGKRYRIQIDALYIINAICFDMSRSFSCVPMIMDTLARKCVNENQVVIHEVYQKYWEWYYDCLKKGRIDSYFPFNDGRYVWKNGRKGKAVEEGF